MQKKAAVVWRGRDRVACSFSPCSSAFLRQSACCCGEPWFTNRHSQATQQRSCDHTGFCWSCYRETLMSSEKWDVSLSRLGDRPAEVTWDDGAVGGGILSGADFSQHPAPSTRLHFFLLLSLAVSLTREPRPRTPVTSDWSLSRTFASCFLLPSLLGKCEAWACWHMWEVAYVCLYNRQQTVSWRGCSICFPSGNVRALVVPCRLVVGWRCLRIQLFISVSVGV